MFIVAQDQGFRPYMEDTYYVEENIINGVSLYAVFDGHGGSFVAEYLQNSVGSVFKELMRTNTMSIVEVIYTTLKVMTENVPISHGMHCGSTCLICVKYGDVLYFANSGDCRAIMNSGPNVIQVTHDHKPNSPSEYDRITGLGGMVTYNPNDAPRVMGNLAVSRSIGDFSLFPFVTWEPEGFVIQYNNNNNILVMASDGLWDTMTNKEVMDIFISDIISSHGVVTQSNLENSARKCIHIAKLKGSMDNITVLVKIL
jgi:protein phosphatase 1L